MNSVGLTVLGVILSCALAGCGSTTAESEFALNQAGTGTDTGNGTGTGTDTGNGTGTDTKGTSNAVGYYFDGNLNDTDNSAGIEKHGEATAVFKTNDDNSIVTVTEEIGFDKSTTTNYVYNEATNKFSGTAKGGDGAEAYLTRQGFTDTSITNGEYVVALITVDPNDESQKVSYRAYRSIDNMTKDMPNSGIAHYEGSNDARYLSYNKVYDIGGDFTADVNFSNSSLKGEMGPSYSYVGFEASIDGAEFTSKKDSITHNGVHFIVDQNLSKVNGAFYGDAAKGIAGDYTVMVNNPGRNFGMVGTFVGEKQ